MAHLTVLVKSRRYWKSAREVQREKTRCDVCGQFVGMKGTRRLLTPDSDRSREEYETLCDKHGTHRN